MPSATFTVSSGSDRIIEVRGPSSGGSASVHSPTSSGGRSFSSASTDSWSQVEAEDEDGIEPSDSASRSRQPTSRRYTTEARPPPPTRRHSSRRVILEQDESPPPRVRRHRSSRTHDRTHHSSRPRRAESRRTPSDESGSVASYDDYPYSHHGAPQPPRHYPPPSGYRHVPAQSHGGYPPASAPYVDPFAQQALVHMPHQDPFGYPQPNPFSPQHQQSNPFSPMSQVSGNSYFAADPHAPPPPPTQHPMRPPGPPRPQSFVAPPSHYGSEMAMTAYPYSAHPGMAPPYGYGQMPWAPPLPHQVPPSHTSSPAPPAPEKPNPEAEKWAAEIDALKNALQEKDDAEKAKTTEEIQNMKTLLKKYEEAQLARERAEAAKKAEEEAEKKRKEEIAAATKKAKEDAEKKAEEALKKAKDEHEKKLAEAKKAQDEAEKKHKELEEEAAKNKPMPDTLKPPIKFKDAVGRKFSFPWHLCKTWKGMETLIKQAFLHVEVIGDHVHAGHYDLTGPDGEIILPQVWDTMVQPDWEITMHMWPMPEEKKAAKDDHVIEEYDDPLAGMFGDLGIVEVQHGKKPKDGKKGKDKKGKKASSPEVIAVPPSMPGGMPGQPLPPNFPPGMLPDPLGGFDGISFVDDKKRPKAKSKGSKDISPFAAWIAGGQVRSKKEDEKLELVRQKTSSSGKSNTDQTSCVVM